ncbi:MAG: outer membrane protein heavy metal efflux system [Blastocatellia bacterium]|jgi:cobalt-zinc-cadmium efflux system outer membrane protein|nr:outer membrane protein heavy metal efflux system [Blastocatellia bacterium]
MNKHHSGRGFIIAIVFAVAQILSGASAALAQSSSGDFEKRLVVMNASLSLPPHSSLTKYSDPQTGMTVDQAVAYALEHNGELLAAHKEIDAASALVKQSTLRANPKLDASVAKTIMGRDNNVTVNGMLPLELGGRRPARIKVAERELDMRRQDVANRERMLAADVRAKFGEALAAILKLGFDEDLIATSQRGYNLVAARVTEGGTAPLEQNMVLVELNRLRSMRETAEGKAQIEMLELRNLLGMTPDEPLRLRGDFNDVIAPLPLLAEATERALSERPDLKLAKAAESFAEARIEQARAEGRLDAGLTAGYQRMDSSYSLNGINDAGQLRPIQGTFNYFTVGVSLELPVRNKNQGTIEAAVAQAEAAKRRREFLELTVRREVASAYAQYNSTSRAAEIFRVGVKDQANANLDVVRQTYELGSKTLIDYLGEQRRFIDLQNGYIDALLDTYKARVEVERATASSTATIRQVTH